MQTFRLKLKSLKFISVVDRPAQEHARAAIIKRDNVDDVTATFAVSKIEPELGVVIGWAFCSKVAGADHVDRQGDVVDEADLVRVAAEYAAAGGAVDEQHDGVSDGGRALFVFPLTTEIASSLGIATDKTGLLAGIKVAPEVLAKFRDGTYTGFSIAGIGERTELTKSAGTDEVAQLRAENERLRAELARANDPRLDAVLAKQADMIAKLAATPNASKSNSLAGELTADQIDDELEQVYEHVADRRGFGRTEAVRWLLGAEAATTSIGKRYRRLRQQANNVKPAAPRATIDYARPSVSKSFRALQLDASWDALVSRHVAKGLDRHAAVRAALRSPEGAQIMAAMDREAQAVTAAAAGLS